MKVKDLLEKTYLITISASVICLLLGILLLIETKSSLLVISIFIGTVLLFVGCSMIYRYFHDGVIRYLFGYSLLYALLDIVMGTFMLINPDSIILLIAIFSGVTLMLEFISKVQLGMLLKDVEISGWIYEIIVGILLLVVAILVILDPITGTLALTKLVAILIIISSIINIIDTISLKYRVKDLHKSIKNIF